MINYKKPEQSIITNKMMLIKYDFCHHGRMWSTGFTTQELANSPISNRSRYYINEKDRFVFIYIEDQRFKKSGLYMLCKPEYQNTPTYCTHIPQEFLHIFNDRLCIGD